ncbi:MAG: type II toxin-antitoxin system RelE/ParE family toxin [Bdellovibrionales bacterium]
MKVSFFTSFSGRCYVEDFIDGLSRSDQAAILAVLKDVEGYGFSAVGCQFRQIEGKLWEIKIKAPTGGYRIFYAMLSSSEMMCLHAYKKQGQKAPKKELEVARKRLKEVLS